MTEVRRLTARNRRADARARIPVSSIVGRTLGWSVVAGAGVGGFLAFAPGLFLVLFLPVLLPASMFGGAVGAALGLGVAWASWEVLIGAGVGMRAATRAATSAAVVAVTAIWTGIALSLMQGADAILPVALSSLGVLAAAVAVAVPMSGRVIGEAGRPS